MTARTRSQQRQQQQQQQQQQRMKVEEKVKVIKEEEKVADADDSEKTNPVSSAAQRAGVTSAVFLGYTRPTPEECHTMHARLAALHGHRHQQPHQAPQDLLDSLVRTILSQNTTDTNSRAAFRKLKQKYALLFPRSCHASAVGISVASLSIQLAFHLQTQVPYLAQSAQGSRFCFGNDHQVCRTCPNKVKVVCVGACACVVEQLFICLPSSLLVCLPASAGTASLTLCFDCATEESRPFYKHSKRSKAR